VSPVPADDTWEDEQSGAAPPKPRFKGIATWIERTEPTQEQISLPPLVSAEQLFWG